LFVSSSGKAVKPRKFPLNDLLRETEVWSTNLRWHAPLDARLSDLVRSAIDAGENTNRSEVVAALVLTAPEDGQELGRRIHQLRLAKVRDTLLQSNAPDESADVIELAERRPGRKRR
jgi:hypothetical protein